MNYGEIEDYVEDFLDITISGTQAGHISASEIEEYIHRGHMRMFRRVANKMQGFCALGENSSNNLISEVADQQTYNLPTNCYRVLMVQRVVAQPNGRSTVPYPLQKVDFIESEVDKEKYVHPYPVQFEDFERYYQFGQKTITLLTGSPAAKTNSLQVFYIFRPAKMTTSTHVPFQESAGSGGAGLDNLDEFHELIALYAMEFATLKDDDLSKHDRIVMKRKEEEAALEEHMRMMNVQSSRGIAITDQDQFDNIHP